MARIASPGPGLNGLAVCAALAVAACGEPDPPSATTTASACETDSTIPIATIQGDGWESPMVGARATTSGVVTLISDDGFYLQSLRPDEHPQTSEALFIPGPRRAGELATGHYVQATGTVSELGEQRDTVTALTGVGQLAVCATGLDLPLADTTLPLSALDREAREGMRLGFRQFVSVTDVYRLGEGDFQVARDGILAAPTEVARPGSDARAQARMNRERSLRLRLPPGNSLSFQVGTTMQRLQGVMGHDGRQQRLLLDERPTFSPPPVYDIPAPAEGTVRVVSLNLFNYFNGDGRGGGFPTGRGADTEAGFERQRARLRAALERLQPHIVAVMELENDGFEAHSAATDFVEDLAVSVPGEWHAVATEPGDTGTDDITVGLFWRRGPIVAVGKPMTLNSKPFQTNNRPPLAQLFSGSDARTRFLVAVNHLKSKGSCPESGPDANQRDGQACWNPVRTEGARSMAQWVIARARETANDRALVMGDMNAYRMEDPIQAILDSGFEDLTAPSGLGHEYSYIYFGEAGTLDYAFGTPAMSRDVNRAELPKINAGWPRDPDLAPAWLGSSDHDPVLVDIRLRQ